MGVSVLSVRDKRYNLGVPRLGKISWTPELIASLGKEPDKVIAQAMGISRTCVSDKRRSLGMRHTLGRRKIAWTSEFIARLGTEPDEAIAHDMGVSVVSVRGKRLSIGERLRKYTRVTWTDESIARLGKEPDTSIARSMGISGQAVGVKRHELGIPKYSGVGLTPREK